MLKAILIHFESLLLHYDAYSESTPFDSVSSYSLYPYTTEYLDMLRRHNIQIVFLTHHSEYIYKELALSLGLYKYADSVFFVETNIFSNSAHTPVPTFADSISDYFLSVCNKLNIMPQEILYIDNCDKGINASKTAGMTTMALLSSFQKGSLMAADIAIESFESIDFIFITQLLDRANGIPLTITSTRRLIIRELAPDDIIDLYTIYKNKAVTKYTDGMNESLEIEIEKHKAYIENVYSFYGYGLWGIFLKDTNTLIGRCGIQNQTIDGIQEIELSYLLDEKHWGKGYALECCRAVFEYAFHTLQIHCITAIIDTENIRSIRLADKLGMICKKQIYHRQRNCYLYHIDLQKEYARREAARNLSFIKVNNNPDTSVYSKRY